MFDHIEFMCQISCRSGNGKWGRVQTSLETIQVKRKSLICKKIHENHFVDRH